jgi:hypothetical protein
MLRDLTGELPESVTIPEPRMISRPIAQQTRGADAVADAMLRDLSDELPKSPTIPKAWIPQPVVSRAPEVVYVGTQVSPPADPFDAILAKEFGVYVQAGAMPPPVPVFEDREP